jgi:membrane-associated PAP2 superfamily phosphatase
MIWDKRILRRPPVYVPLIVALFATLVTLFADIDFAVANLFYNHETGKWFLQRSLIEKAVYSLSPVPAFVVFFGGVIVALGSIWRKSWRRWTRGAVYWSLVMLLGPGLIVNAIFKDWYGRPRPTHVIEYGGTMSFCPVGVIGEPGRAKSFPCGHASIGFYFMAGYFYWWRKNLPRARWWLFAGLMAGWVIGFFRMAKGAHWFSDVVWSGTFVYFVSYLSAWGCGLLRSSAEDQL